MSDDTMGRILSGSAFLDAGLSLHSLLLEKDGELLIEAYSKPWDKESLHRMYSVTKSVVSLAVGKLAGKGLLRLSDQVVRFFPDLLPEEVPYELASLTIENMLKMETCHSFTTYKQGAQARYIPSWRKNWLWSFFNTPPDHQPGMIFKYDTSSTHVLASLVERISGQDFLTFVRENIIDLDSRTYITRDPEGHPCGGSGLMMTSRDLLRLARRVMESDDGYVRKATSRLVETSSVLTGEDNDLECGYGYQFWRLSHNAYCMYGMGGQFAIMVPERNTVAVTTADTMGTAQGERKLLRLLWPVIERIENPIALDIKPLVAVGAPFTRNDNVSYSFPDNPTRITFICFGFGDSRLEMTADGVVYDLSFSYGDRARSPFPAECIDSAYSSAAFLPDGSFSFLSELVGEELGIIKLKAAFSGNSVTICSECFGEVRFRGFNGTATGYLAHSFA